ncbi:twin-arginine translocase subunit TatC [Nibricoccus sp. IMCC34717]|uniref:twin-arginine translocase subunit TatC n=1 Tax=Nibricoccus sp. IMCC34717 TaxID=3034021 RepID=UPI00385002D7
MAVDNAAAGAEAEDNDPGPRKTFWEHVEDLRKVLVRSAIAIGLAFVVCIFLDKQLVGILEYPLKNIDKFMGPPTQVAFQLGETTLGPYPVDAKSFPLIGDTKGTTTFTLGTARIGDENVVVLKPIPPEQAPEPGARVHLHNIAPADGFLIAFKVAIYASIVVSAPFWIYNIASFVLPALHIHERRIVYQWLGWGTFLFMSGVLLTYFILLPLALHASVKYSEMLGFSATLWKADDYISFVTKFVLGMGIGFQFPVVILILVKLGFLTHHTLIKYRRHVIVLCFILGAVLTTPEVITQVAMALPLWLLYEISIVIAWYWDRQKRKAEAAAA